MISRQEVMHYFEKYKRKATLSFMHAKYSACAYYLKKAAWLMYNFNIVYADSELDALLLDLSRSIRLKPKSEFKNADCITFFDSFAMSYRGLAWIYVKALLDLGYVVQYITYRRHEQAAYFLPLKRFLEQNSIRIEFIDELGFEKQARSIQECIDDFSPEAMLFHGTPFDISALAAISSFEGKVKRFLINLTDHAFWLGSKSFDAFIEFRDFGYSVSKACRGIAEENLFCLPYYPVQIIAAEPFGGLPLKDADRFIVSGGSPYKIEGSDAFPVIVRRILDNEPDIHFIFLGNGSAESIDCMIDEYDGRLIHLEERRDLLAIIERSEVYLSTYPLYGGLMTQIAAAAGKVPVTFALQGHEGAASLLLDKSIKIDFDSIDEVVQEVHKLLTDSSYQSQRANELAQSVLTPDRFAQGLKQVLQGTSPFPFRDFPIQPEKFSEQYLSRCKSHLELAKLIACKEDLKSREILSKTTWLGLFGKTLDKGLGIMAAQREKVQGRSTEDATE